MRLFEKGAVRRLGAAGFTVVELLVYMVIAMVLLVGVYQLLIGQGRLYSKQRELQDVRTTMRTAANLLAWELRQASAAEGDLYDIDIYEFTVRSVQGMGFVCAAHPSQPRYGLAFISGEFYATSEDSVMMYALEGPGSSDDGWVIGTVGEKWSSGGGTPYCFYGDSNTVATDIVLEVYTVDPEEVEEGEEVEDEDKLPLSGVVVGAPVRAFRRVNYGLYVEGDRWWLGRKVGDADSYERLTGPLSAPSDSGLVFVYYDRSGNVTADPSAVAFVDIILRAESFGKVRQAGELSPTVEQDTLTMRVSLRG
ncbi:MAG: hypothetical protein PVG79_12405 [Gemmatimonadales bacterium]|jgi:hypothetical protein